MFYLVQLKRIDQNRTESLVVLQQTHVALYQVQLISPKTTSESIEAELKLDLEKNFSSFLLCIRFLPPSPTFIDYLKQ